MTKYTGPIKEVEVVEKVKLTKEQAEAIDWLMDEEYSIGDILNSHIYGWSAQNTACLNKLKISQIAEVLYTENYEIEPEQPKFQPGDKVMKVDGHPFPGGMKIRDLTAIYESWHICDGESRNNPIKYRESELRHATQEEIFWLEKLGRKKVADFKYRDVVRGKDDYIYEVSDNDRSDDHILGTTAEEWYSQGRLTGIYPAESFLKFPKE